jgi:large subunit ribosomal protein L10
MVLDLKSKALERKTKEVDQLVDLINKYKVFGIASLYKVRAKQLQELAKKFRSDVYMRVSKKEFIIRAIKKCGRVGIEKLENDLLGSNILIFTDMNPFKLTLLFDRNKIKTTAKAGDIAPDDIMISEGNTGMPPGPAISELHEAGIRTRINSGSVWVLQDTVVTKQGEPIPPKVASVLSKLGVKPLEVRLKMVVAYYDKLAITSEQLSLDLDEIQAQIEKAYRATVNLAVSLAYPTPETINLILQKAYFKAKNVAISSNYPAVEVMKEIIARANLNMLSLASKLAKINKDISSPSAG